MFGKKIKSYKKTNMNKYYIVLFLSISNLRTHIKDIIFQNKKKTVL